MEWWQILLGVIVGLLLLDVLVILHELGHALTAIRGGVVVEEFGLGFPPRAWSTELKKKFILPKGTIVSLNWLPIGGFCKMKGEVDDAKEKGSYGAASLWVKTKILLAGVTANFLGAIVIFTVLSLFGIPKVFEGQFVMPGDEHITNGPVIVGSVTDDLPAATAGLKAGDEIIAIDGEVISDSTQVPKITSEKHGQTITVEYKEESNNELLTANVNLRDDNSDGRGYLGMTSGQSSYIRATWSAPIVGVVTTAQYTWLTLQGLGDLFVNLATGIAGKITGSEAAENLSAAGDAVAGPVGILGNIFPAALAGGPIELAFITGIISLSLAVMNLLPIPGLDGGRWYLTLFFRFILRRPLKEDTEGLINAIGMCLLFALIILITVVDILKIV
ncbi:MAG: M50 family metallopeptidase [Candidatus Nomurabacteria bacterium]|jgi:regulator of sigma E protease|nr:M50 family metallopeptidase [Candidatus Nomurabacteria bacterium]